MSLSSAGRLPHIVGLHEAKKLLLLGEDIPAPRASVLKLVSEICDDSLRRAQELGTQIAQRSTRSISMIKRGIESAAFPNLDHFLDSETDAASWCFADERSLEVFETFKSKRASKFVEPPSGRPEGGNHQFRNPPNNLVDALKMTTLKVPSAVFLRFGTEDTSFVRFLAEVQRQADGLAKAGIRSGDVIAAMMVNSKEMACLWFASMWIGAIWAPLHVSTVHRWRGMPY